MGSFSAEGKEVISLDWYEVEWGVKPKEAIGILKDVPFDAS